MIKFFKINRLNEQLAHAVSNECRWREIECWNHNDQYMMVQCSDGEQGIRTWEDFRFVFGGKGWERSAPEGMPDPYEIEKRCVNV